MLAGFLSALLVVDLIVAYPCSPALTQSLLGVLKSNAAAGITFKNLRVHPLFISFSLEDVKITDPDIPRIQVLRWKRLRLLEGRLCRRSWEPRLF